MIHHFDDCAPSVIYAYWLAILTGTVVPQVTPDTFLTAEKEIYRLMSTDSFPRFKQSELFQEFLDNNDKALKKLHVKDHGYEIDALNGALGRQLTQRKLSQKDSVATTISRRRTITHNVTKHIKLADLVNTAAAASSRKKEDFVTTAPTTSPPDTDADAVAGAVADGTTSRPNSDEPPLQPGGAMSASVKETDLSRSKTTAIAPTAMAARSLSGVMETNPTFASLRAQRMTK